MTQVKRVSALFFIFCSTSDQRVEKTTASRLTTNARSWTHNSCAGWIKPMARRLPATQEANNSSVGVTIQQTLVPVGLGSGENERRTYE